MHACRQSLNLDGPFLERYGRYLERAVHLDFGHNIRTEEPVRDEILKKLPATVELSVVALVLAFSDRYLGGDALRAEARHLDRRRGADPDAWAASRSPSSGSG